VLVLGFFIGVFTTFSLFFGGEAIKNRVPKERWEWAYLGLYAADFVATLLLFAAVSTLK